MPVVSTDLVLYASANLPDADTGSAGGAIDLLRRLDFTQLAANAAIEAVSSAAGDTMNLTIEARRPDGSVVSETKALNGTTAIDFTVNGTVERILKAELASAPAGTITVRSDGAGTTYRTIAAGERGFWMMFRKTSSDPAAQRDYFTKAFWKNNHATLALQSAVVKQNADPDARITHLLASAKADTATSTNRLTAPAAGDTQDPDTFDDTDKTVPGGTLGAGETIGVWLRLRLPAADVPHRTTYTLELSGTST